MSILKRSFLLLITLSVMMLIVAIFVKGEVKVQRSIDIDAPVEAVWNLTSNITSLNRWNSWFRRDKMMKTAVAGTEGHPGSQFCWESDSTELGKGCLTITRLTTLRETELDILYHAPWKTQAKAYISLQPMGTTTRVTLNFNSRCPYPLRIILLFKPVEKMIATNYRTSLQELKRLAEDR